MAVVCNVSFVFKRLYIFVVVQPLSRVRLFGITWTVSPPGSSVHGILQARILKWVAVPFSSCMYLRICKSHSYKYKMPQAIFKVVNVVNLLHTLLLVNYLHVTNTFNSTSFITTLCC